MLSVAAGPAITDVLGGETPEVRETDRSVAAEGLAVCRNCIVAWSAVVVLTAGVVVLVDFDRVGLRGSDIRAPEALGFRGEIGGMVRSLDANTHVVTVARGMLDFFSIPIAITTDTRVNVRGKLGAFGDLREGQSLSVCYEVLPSGRWARSIEIPASSAPCSAVAESAPSESPDERRLRRSSLHLAPTPCTTRHVPSFPSDLCPRRLRSSRGRRLSRSRLR